MSDCRCSRLASTQSISTQTVRRTVNANLSNEKYSFNFDEISTIINCKLSDGVYIIRIRISVAANWEYAVIYRWFPQITSQLTQPWKAVRSENVVSELIRFFSPFLTSVSRSFIGPKHRRWSRNDDSTHADVPTKCRLIQPRIARIVYSRGHNDVMRACHGIIWIFQSRLWAEIRCYCVRSVSVINWIYRLLCKIASLLLFVEQWVKPKIHFPSFTFCARIRYTYSLLQLDNNTKL